MVIELPPDFSEFLKLLNSHCVEYLLIGGFAVGFHGYPRATSDIDIWVGRSPENAKRVVAAIRLSLPPLIISFFLPRRPANERISICPFHRHRSTAERRADGIHAAAIDYAGCCAAASETDACPARTDFDAEEA